MSFSVHVLFEPGLQLGRSVSETREEEEEEELHASLL
jgi:hypothetical protein